MTFVFVLAVGCDNISSIALSTKISALPAKSEVEAAIRAVPEIQGVEYTQVPSESSWSIYDGTVREPAYDQFSYRAVGAYKGTVEVRQTSKGERVLGVYCNWMNIIPTPAEATEVRNLMDKVYESLHQHIEVVPPSSSALRTEIRFPQG